MTTPIPDEPFAKTASPLQQALRPRGGESGPPEPSLPPVLTVGEALSRWRDAHARPFEPLLAAGELHGVMPRLKKRVPTRT